MQPGVPSTCFAGLSNVQTPTELSIFCEKIIVPNFTPGSLQFCSATFGKSKRDAYGSGIGVGLMQAISRSAVAVCDSILVTDAVVTVSVPERESGSSYTGLNGQGLGTLLVKNGNSALTSAVTSLVEVQVSLSPGSGSSIPGRKLVEGMANQRYFGVTQNNCGKKGSYAVSSSVDSRATIIDGSRNSQVSIFDSSTSKKRDVSFKIVFGSVPVNSLFTSSTISMPNVGNIPSISSIQSTTILASSTKSLDNVSKAVTSTVGIVTSTTISAKLVVSTSSTASATTVTRMQSSTVRPTTVILDIPETPDVPVEAGPEDWNQLELPEAAVNAGCWTDNAATPDVGPYKTVLPNMAGPLDCYQECVAQGFTVSGTQSGTTCFCGTSFGNYNNEPGGHCFTPCPGDSTETCGGPKSNQIIFTGSGDTLTNTNSTDHATGINNTPLDISVQKVVFRESDNVGVQEESGYIVLASQPGGIVQLSAPNGLGQQIPKPKSPNARRDAGNSVHLSETGLVVDDCPVSLGETESDTVYIYCNKVLSAGTEAACQRQLGYIQEHVILSVPLDCAGG
ncbi:hypothetical protein HDU99_000576, partial [Rhizoclosmatium hyalinum]